MLSMSPGEEPIPLPPRPTSRRIEIERRRSLTFARYPCRTNVRRVRERSSQKPADRTGRRNQHECVVFERTRRCPCSCCFRNGLRSRNLTLNPMRTRTRRNLMKTPQSRPGSSA
jgi:hypothetical protein